MDYSYNRIAGQSKERLAAISDGIFGVAMTLLLLEIQIPDAAKINGSEGSLLRAIEAMTPDCLVYLMSFITLGIFWVGQQTQLNYLERSDRNLTWLHLAFLFPVTILPFATRLLTTFTGLRVALLLYWFNILVLGALLYACWGYTVKAKLIPGETPEEVKSGVCHRIVIAQVFYATGAALCVFSTYLSIAFIVLVQLNYVIDPRQWLARKPAPSID